MPDSPLPHEEARRLVETSGRTQREVADYLNEKLRLPPNKRLKHYHVSRMLKADRPISSAEMDALRLLVEKTSNSEQLQPAPASIINWPGTDGYVPLFSSGAGGRLRLIEENRVGEVQQHPLQAGKRGGFAFMVFGDLIDRANHGDVGYGVRNVWPKIGQPCLIEKTDGEQLLRIYDGQDEATLFVHVDRPKRRDTPVPLREVAAVHAIVGVGFG